MVAPRPSKGSRKTSPLGADVRRGKSAFTVKLTCKGCMNEQAVIMRNARDPLHGIQTQCSECGSIDWMIRAPEDEA